LVAAAGIVFVGKFEIPPVKAVFASVGNDVARFPYTVLPRHRQKVAPAAAVDAGDVLIWH
jgi:hypothetical protein